MRLFGLRAIQARLAHVCTVNEGDRIAQLILERIVTPDVVEVQVRNMPMLRCSVSVDPPRPTGP